MDGLLKTVQDIENEDDFSFKKLFVPLTTTKAITWIVIIGFVVYANMFFNGFVWDDNTFIINNPQVHQLNILSLIGPSMFNSTEFYRPIPAVYFAFLYSLFGQQAFYYHFMQLALHVTVTCLLFLYLKYFFKSSLAFFLSLIFLVHPINVESVAYIGSTQSELYFLPGIIALLLSRKKHLTLSRFICINVLLLLSLLVKETGFLFLLLIVAERYLFKLYGIKKFLLSGAVILIIYFVLRFFVGGVSIRTVDAIPIDSLPLLQRLLHIPIIIEYYLKIFFLPIHLAVWQLWILKNISVQNFFIPLFVCLLFIAGWLFVFMKIKKVAHSQINDTILQRFYFFSFWFVIGMGILLQIVPLDMTVADRWFYFPIVGLLGIIGTCFQIFPLVSKHKVFVLICMVTILCMLSMRTFVRNMDWQNEVNLFTHDSKIEDNFELENSLAVDLASKGDYVASLKRLQRSVSLGQSETTVTNLAIMEAINHDYPAAEKYFSAAYNSQSSNSFFPHKHGTLLYTNYAKFLIFTDNSQLAEQVIRQGLNEYPPSMELWAYEAMEKYKEGEMDHAIYAANKMYSLSPNSQTFYIYSHIKNKEPFTFSVFNHTYTFRFHNRSSF
jgi:hypothetical protein